MSENRTPPIIAGFIEGLMLPVVELMLTVLFLAGIKVVETANEDSSFLILTFIILGIADFARNILIGISTNQFATGSFIGNVFGLILFYSAISSVSQEAATQSVLLTIVLGISLGVGVYLRYFRPRESEYLL